MPIFLTRSGESFPEDVRRIRHCVEDHGYVCTRQDATRLWEEYSDDMCAGWLILPPEDHQLWACVEPHIREQGV